MSIWSTLLFPQVIFRKDPHLNGMEHFVCEVILLTYHCMTKRREPVDGEQLVVITMRLFTNSK